MPPKKVVIDTAAVAEPADTNTKKRKNAAAAAGDSTKGQVMMNEREYMLYATLRVVQAQTGATIDWNLVRDATGDTVNASSLSKRYSRLTTGNVGVDDGRELPDLAVVLERAKSGSSKPVATKKGKTTSSISDNEDDAGDEAEKDKPKAKRAKTTKKIVAEEDEEAGGETPKKKTRTRKAKVMESIDENNEVVGKGDAPEKPNTKKKVAKPPQNKHEEAPQWEDRHCSDLEDGAAA